MYALYAAISRRLQTWRKATGDTCACHLVQRVHSSFALVVFNNNSRLLYICNDNFVNAVQTGNQNDTPIWRGHVWSRSQNVLKPKHAAFHWLVAVRWHLRGNFSFALSHCSTVGQLTAKKSANKEILTKKLSAIICKKTFFVNKSFSSFKSYIIVW